LAAVARPQTVFEAVRLLAAGRWRIVAGATDLYPPDVVRRFRGESRFEAEIGLLDITAIDTLREIRWQGDRLVFGAAVTWSDVAHAELPVWCHGLKQAAREVGGLQIQNRGTIGGNLCNASPAADGIPPLLALNAEVVLAAASGRRILPLSAFLLGNRQTAVRADELLEAVRVPDPGQGLRSVFYKLGARRYLVIAIVALAASLKFDAQGRLHDPRFAVGACAPTAVRLSALEAELAGLDVETACARIRPDRLVELAPIDDVRATATYRLEATAELLRRAIRALAEDARPAGGLVR
jgi:CO/xanthine dehydrogenase FAD-binding subunit